MKLIAFILLNLCILSAFSCGGGGGGSSNNSVNEPDPVNATVNFQKVQTIISDNCSSCHGTTLANNAPMSLVTYSQISLFANSISTRIKKSTNDSQLMPPGGPKLSNEDIASIDTWISEGKLNN